ncbi:MAG: ZIP family metal transporter [Leeuwenhoekiella sp.]
MTFYLPILAVALGFVIAVFLKPALNTGIKLLLSFSGAFLLSVTVFEFLPEIYAVGVPHVGLFIMMGLLLQLLLEFLSKGAEHGHVHATETASKVPVLLILSLSVHAVLEGFPLGQNEDILYGVVVHKIPIAIIVSTFLLKEIKNRWTIGIILLTFALMTPLGSLIGVKTTIPMHLRTQINAVVVGVLLHVSTTILFESSKNHQFNASKFGVILLGIALAYFL